MEECCTSSNPLIVVIHTNEKDRNVYLFPKIELLASSINGNVKFISEGMHKIFSILDVLKYTFSIYFITRKSLVRNLKEISLNVNFENFLLSVRYALSTLRLNLKTRMKLYNVTSKHYIAYKEFILKPENKLLIVFENDVRFKETSIGDLNKLISLLEPMVESDYVYCDLAGGIDPKIILRNDLLFDPANPCIGLNSQAFQSDEQRLLIKLPCFVTNTVCAYLINRKVAQHLVDGFEKTSIYTPDWYLNEILYRIEDLKASTVTCFFPVPPIFEHGSATGSYNSTLESKF